MCISYIYFHLSLSVICFLILLPVSFNTHTPVCGEEERDLSSCGIIYIEFESPAESECDTTSFPLLLSFRNDAELTCVSGANVYKGNYVKRPPTRKSHVDSDIPLNMCCALCVSKQRPFSYFSTKESREKWKKKWEKRQREIDGVCISLSLLVFCKL